MRFPLLNNSYFQHVQLSSLRTIFKLNIFEMQTLSQIDALDTLKVAHPQSSSKSKRLGRAKDSIRLKGHYVKFVKCVNASSDGTIASYNPTHGHVAIEVYYLNVAKVGNKERMTLVQNINVIISSLPSEKLTIELVTLINFKVKRGEQEDNRAVYYYEGLILDSILELYAKDVRIVTSPTVFDVGGKIPVGEAANKWFASRFKLPRCFQGIVVLQKGVM